jgi:hypothetical protein
MQDKKKIELYQVRNFSEVMGATIDFIRQQFKPLMSAILLVFTPIALINGILMTRYFVNIFNFASNPQDLDNFNPFLLVFGGGNMVMFFISILALLVLTAMVFQYFVLYQKNEGEVTFNELWNSLWQHVLPLFGYHIVFGIMLVIAFLLLVIPGLYLMPIISLGLAALVFEKKGIFESFSRAYELIKNHWWQTFGILIVAYIFQNIVSNVFAIPFFGIYFKEIFTMAINEEIPNFSNTGTQLYLGFSFFVMMLGSYITYLIPFIAIAFQYFSLSEEKEASGLMKEVDDFDVSKNQGGGIEV